VWIGPILESEASAASSSTPKIQLPSQEAIGHKRKRRRRRRNENDEISIENDDSSSKPEIITHEKISHATKSDFGPVAAVLTSSSPIDELLPSQEKIAHKKKSKRRKRRKAHDAIVMKEGVSLLKSHIEEDRKQPIAIESNHKLVQTTEDIEKPNLHMKNDDSSSINSTIAATFNKGNDKDGECKTTDVLLSQSQLNIPNETDEVTAAESSVVIVKDTDKKQNDVKKNKKKRAAMKKPLNASKSTTTPPSTGKEGECLRRIKHEWKDAVKSGIAYDWINMKTIRNANTSSSSYVRIGPFGKNLLRWHFSVAGPANSVYENGIYHGRVLLPKDYPASPPRVQMITPSGRFIPGIDICLSASSYHPETWTPRWTVLSLVDALRLHMLTTANEIGGVLATDDKRRQYALESRSWKYPGIANHERMIAENIFVTHSMENDEDSNGIEENTTSEEPNNNSSASDESNSRDDLKDDEIKDIATKGDTTMGLPPSLEQEKDSSKRVSVEKKSKKKKKSNDLQVKHTDTKTEKAVVLSSQLSTIHEADASKPASATRTKKQKKSTVTPSLKTVEGSAHGTTKRAKDASNKRNSAKKKEKNQKKLTDIDVQAKGHDNHNIMTIVLKRLLIEILKLPLRVLATMIRILDRLEKYMRAILDSI